MTPDQKMLYTTLLDEAGGDHQIAFGLAVSTLAKIIPGVSFGAIRMGHLSKEVKPPKAPPPPPLDIAKEEAPL